MGIVAYKNRRDGSGYLRRDADKIGVDIGVVCVANEGEDAEIGDATQANAQARDHEPLKHT
jgi:hypothetical protein